MNTAICVAAFSTVAESTKLEDHSFEPPFADVDNAGLRYSINIYIYILFGIRMSQNINLLYTIGWLINIGKLPELLLSTTILRA